MPKISDVLKITILTVVLAGIMVAEDYLLPQPYLHPYKWYLLGFFFIMSATTTYITGNGLKKNPSTFQSYFFAAMLLRMLISILVIFVCVKQGTKDILSFVITFFVMYFLYVTIEVLSLLNTLKNQYNA